MMEKRKSITVFERDVSKGFIPRNIGKEDKERLLRVIDGLLQIEQNIESAPPSVLDGVLAKQLSYPDMFMRTTLQEERKNHSLSVYPPGWLGAFGEFLDEEVSIDDNSDLCCHREAPFAISVFEIQSIPLLRFKSPSSYVIFMLSIYHADYANLESLFENAAPSDYVAMLDRTLAGSKLTDDALVLFEFLLYRAISVQVMQNQVIKSYLVGTRGRKIVSKVTFPSTIQERMKNNFYGRLWMRLRELGL